MLHYHLGQLYIQRQNFELARDSYLVATKVRRPRSFSRLWTCVFLSLPRFLSLSPSASFLCLSLSLSLSAMFLLTSTPNSPPPRALSLPFALQLWSCGIHWLGLGISYFHLADYDHAEQALAVSEGKGERDSPIIGAIS